MNKYFQNVGARIKAAFSIGAIVMAGKALVNFGKEAVQLGGELAGVKNAFDQLNQPGLLDELRSATGGTITDLQLMKNAVKADEFNIPVEKMATMMQFASMQGQKMGESVDYMVDSITTGLARGSLPILDNLGLSAKELQAEMIKTGNITDAAFNVINKKIAESGGIIETSATITARWAARWENMKAVIGLLINNALVKIAPILEEIRTFFVNLWETSTKFIIDTYNGYVDLYNESKLFRSIVESIGLTFKIVWESVKLFFRLFIDNIKNTGRILAYVINPKNWGDGFGDGLKEILFKNGAEIVSDVKEWGNNIGTGFKDAINDTKKDGEASYISIDDIISSGTINQVKTKATEIGKIIKTEFGAASGAAFGELGKGGFLEVFKKSMESIKQLSTDAGAAFGNFTGKLIESTKTARNTFSELGAAMGAKMSDIKLRIIDFANTARESVRAMFTDIFAQLGEALGNLLAGSFDNLKSVFTSILNIIIDFGMSLGKQMIAMGVAAIALKKLFKNPFTAIAAGVGLIALMTLVKSKINEGGPKFAIGGIVPGSAYTGDKVNIMANSGEMILNKGQQASLFRQINSGAVNTINGILTARISGNDLLFVVEQAKNKQGFSY